ncbi:MAG: hypothetical protein SNF93_06500 [Rikenellaceae bacterium]
MKSLKYFALFAFMSLFMVGCDDTTIDTDDSTEQGGSGDDNDSDGDGDDYSDYEAQEIDVVASQEYTVIFSVSSAWSALADVSWIQFKNESLGGSLFSSLIGQAGDDQTFTVSINDENLDFGNDQGKITLTLSDESKVVIAVLTRQGNEPSISFTYMNYETYADEELNIEETFVLGWNDNSFSYAGKIGFTANFPWRIEGLPDWITNSTSSPIQTEGSADDVFSQLLSTSYANYLDAELMEATITVVCQTNSDISYSLDIQTQGAKGLMSLIRADAYYGFVFDADATYYSDLYSSRYTYYTFSCIVESNPSLCEPFAVSCSADGIFSEDSQIVDWVHTNHTEEITYDDSDNYVGGVEIEDTKYTYLTQFERWLSVDENELSQERSAAIFVLPSSVTFDSVADLYDSTTGEVKEEYAPYIIERVTQAALITEAQVELYNSTSYTTTVAISQYAEDSQIAIYYAGQYDVPVDAIFLVTYATAGSAQFKFPLGCSYTAGYTIDPSSTSWISYEATDEYFTLTMSNTEANKSGYIILKNSAGENAVYIRCTQTAI